MMLVKKFYLMYNSVADNNKILKQLRFYSFYRLIIRVWANLLLPIYFKYRKKVMAEVKRDDRTIISLTSFPARINKVWLVIECLLRQEVMASKIILWLSRDQFPTIDRLPINLQSQIKRGLEIRLVDGDIRSHKKYFYVFKEYTEQNIITVDDDMYYPEDFVKTLLESNARFPRSIISCYARKLSRKDGRIMPYNVWPRAFEDESSIEDLFFGSGGGTLFPAKSLYQDLLNKDLFLKLTPAADDIWLNAMSRLNNTSIRYISFIRGYIPIAIFDNETLASKNLDQNLNDLQIENVNDYYFNFGKKVFM